MRSEVPVLIKSNDTKLGQPRSEDPAPTKLNDQHDTHGMPVRARTMACRAVPFRLAQPCTRIYPVHRKPRAITTVAAYHTNLVRRKPDLRCHPA